MKLFRKITGSILLAAFALALPTTLARADDAADSTKYKLQSVFIYNFISSVEWPKLMYSGNVKNIDLCIIGQDKLGKVMDLVAKKAEGKGDIKINIRRGVSGTEINSCNIAYISISEAANAAAIAKSASSAVLTVSEVPDFAKQGGVIEFVLKGANVGFKVNNKTAKKLGLKIDPQLMEAASEVID